MLIKTRYFGEIELKDDKVITFEKGLMGFEDYKKYTILYDSEKEEKPLISWLQSLDEPGLAFPILNPLFIKEDYNPVVEDELLTSIGETNEGNIALFVILTVPADITKMTVNLKAPIIINSDTKKGCQIIVENADYEVRYHVYSVLKDKNEEVE